MLEAEINHALTQMYILKLLNEEKKIYGVRSLYTKES